MAVFGMDFLLCRLGEEVGGIVGFGSILGADVCYGRGESKTLTIWLDSLSKNRFLLFSDLFLPLS